MKIVMMHLYFSLGAQTEIKILNRLYSTSPTHRQTAQYSGTFHVVTDNTR